MGQGGVIMIPSSGKVSVVIKKEPSLTYELDFENKCVKGMVDGLDAVIQSINLILNTERFKYEILSWDYGVELENLMGDEIDSVYPKIKKRINEALFADDRITGTSDFKFSRLRDEVSVRFIVHTIFGDKEKTLEVNI
jgi:hypothetical protein